MSIWDKIFMHTGMVFEQLQKGQTIGNRKTPVFSLWPMRPKWEKYGEVWEMWGTDGDLRVDNDVPIAPAELKLVYIRIPNTDLVCQLAYETEPEQVETRDTALRRAQRVQENLKAAGRKPLTP